MENSCETKGMAAGMVMNSDQQQFCGFWDNLFSLPSARVVEHRLGFDLLHYTFPAKQLIPPGRCKVASQNN